MKYFIDTEFHEYQKPVKFLGLTIKKVWTIELISIGIVCEDGREFYACNADLDLRNAKKDEWLNKNVISKLPKKNVSYYDSPRLKEESRAWRSMDGIKRGILQFVMGDFYGIQPYYFKGLTQEQAMPQFWGYYSDYDWVVFCWIFGRMIDLPKGFPMYCRDLKQELDLFSIPKEWLPEEANKHNALADAMWVRDAYNVMYKYAATK